MASGFDAVLTLTGSRRDLALEQGPFPTDLLPPSQSQASPRSQSSRSDALRQGRVALGSRERRRHLRGRRFDPLHHLEQAECGLAFTTFTMRTCSLSATTGGATSRSEASASRFARCFFSMGM